VSLVSLKTKLKRAAIRFRSFVLRGRYVNRKKLNAVSYLNIGCGRNTLPEFMNLDFTLWPGVDVCWDLRKPLPFEDDSFKGVFTEHCLEHLEYGECIKVLGEFFRVLKSGSLVRVIVPDGGLYLALYAKAQSGENVNFPYVGEAGKNDFISDSMVSFTPMMAVNRIFRSYGHRFAYDFETIASLLKYVGFVDVYRRDFGVGGNELLLIDSEYRAPQSLYVEAVKP